LVGRPFNFPVYPLCSRANYPRVKKMSEEKPTRGRSELDFGVLRLDPEKRLCSKYDAVSIKLFPMARPGEMGMRVLDDCAEEHIM